jgi:hypothetical protein
MEVAFDVSKEVIGVNPLKTYHIIMFRHHTTGEIIRS